MKNIKTKKRIMAYGGTGYLTPDITYDVQKGQQGVQNQMIDLYNDTAFLDDFAGLLASVGGGILKSTGTPVGSVIGDLSNIAHVKTPGNMLGVVAGTALNNINIGNRQQPLEFNSGTYSDIQGNTYVNGVLQNKNSQQTMQKYNNGGTVNPVPVKQRFNYNGVGRPVKIKNYPMNGKDRYYIFQDYDEAGQMPVGQNEMNAIVRQMMKNNPGMLFINGDYGDLNDRASKRALYDANDDVYQERYNQNQVWFTKTPGLDTSKYADINLEKSYSSVGQQQDLVSRVNPITGETERFNSEGERIDDGINSRINTGRNKPISQRRKAAQGEMDNFLMDKILSSRYAFGGGVLNVPVEVEGQEVAEFPNGRIGEFIGSTHEQGGIPVSLPEGTEIFSNRIKVDNVTMADRKKKRHRKQVKLEKLIDEYNDAIFKNSLNRVINTNAQEEEADMKIQDFVNQISNPSAGQFAYGGNPIKRRIKSPNYVNEFTSYPYRGVEVTPQMWDDVGEYYSLATGQQPDLSSGQAIANTFGSINFDTSGNPLLTDSKPGINHYNALSTGIPAFFDNRRRRENIPVPVLATPGIVGGNIGVNPLTVNNDKPLSGLTGDPNFNNNNSEELIGQLGGDKGNNPIINSEQDLLTLLLDGDGSGLGIMDGVGIIGNYNNARGYKEIIDEERRGNNPNTNFYKDFGKKGLSRIEDLEDNLIIQHDKNLGDLTSARNKSVAGNTSNARSINTQRALAMGSDAQLAKAQNDAVAQLMTALAHQTQMEAGQLNQMDRVVMGAEDERDVRDRQDRAQYYMNLIKAWNAKNKALKENVDIVNNARERKFLFNAINNTYNDVEGTTSGRVRQKRKR